MHFFLAFLVVLTQKAPLPETTTAQRGPQLSSRLPARLSSLKQVFKNTALLTSPLVMLLVSCTTQESVTSQEREILEKLRSNEYTLVRKAEAAGRYQTF